MKNNTNYKDAKKELLNIAKLAKKEYKNDKPAIRQIINDKCYFLTYNLTSYENDLLHNYASKLHP